MKLLNALCDKVIGTLARVGPFSLRCKVQPFLEVGMDSTEATPQARLGWVCPSRSVWGHD